MTGVYHAHRLGAACTPACHQIERQLDAVDAELEELEPLVRMATFADGSQLLVELYVDGRMLAAVRPQRHSTWGPPVELVEP